MQDVTTWLAGFGLEKYADVFAANEIDFNALRQLTEDDLKELALPLGPRRKLMTAILALREPAPVRDKPESVRSSPDRPPTDAERRQLTILFADLVGSTELAAGLDPEDLRAIISTYHRVVADTASRFGGFVAKYMGDGVLLYFGYPKASEDAAERAVRTGLAIASAVRRLGHAGHALDVRVGIATGLVVVGDLLGQGTSAQEESVVGETPNLAARLQTAAEPGTVVVADSTRRLIGGLFDYDDLGVLGLKGFAQPVRVWRVLRESAIGSRFEALRSSPSAPLVGREEELELLLRRWRRAKEGEGQLVLLSGEAGLGKSRLLAALEEQVREEPHVRLRYFCSPQHQDSALAPFIGQLERALERQADDPPDKTLANLEALLARGAAADDDAALVAELLGLRPDVTGYTPQRRKERILDALARQLGGLARELPVLAIFEDAHWADATSLDLLDLGFARTLGRTRVLTVVTFRPEFQPRWIGRPHVTSLTLSRLDHRNGAAIAQRVAGDLVLPPEIIEEIVQRTDGVPLFVEEFTKTVIESGHLRPDGGQSRAQARLPPFAIPATLYDALMARLDRIAAVKEVAQVGAAIGREFTWRLLSAVIGLPDAKLRQALDQLVAGELIFQRGVPPDAVYTFKHALVQDATYGSLLRDRRQHLHQRVVELLETEFPDDATPEIVAHHATEAGMLDKATALWREAGDNAVKRSAIREATNHYRRAIGLIARQEPSAERDDRELRLLLALGPVLMATMPTRSPEVADCYVRARELARRHGRSNDLFITLWGAWLIANTGEEPATANRLVDELRQLAEELDDPGARLQAIHADFSVAYIRGDFGRVLELGDRTRALYDSVAHRDHAMLFGGHDPCVCADSATALCLALLGRTRDAYEAGERGVALAREIGHVPSLVHALRFLGDAQFVAQDVPAARRTAETILDMPPDHLTVVSRANALMLRAWAATASGETTTGLEQMRAGLESWRATGSVYAAAYRLGRAADAFLRGGDIATARGLLEEAEAQAQRTEEHWFSAELRRLSGVARLAEGQAGGNTDPERPFRDALDLARAREARRLEFRAATSLARLWDGIGRRDEARELLAPLYAAFRAEERALDVAEARAVLDRL